MFVFTNNIIYCEDQPPVKYIYMSVSVCSKILVMLLLIHLLFVLSLFAGGCDWSLFCYALLSGLSLFQSSDRGRNSWLLYFNLLLAVERLDETSIVDKHRCHMAAKFGLFVDEDHSKLPTLYWLPKLHKRPYKSRFIANSSACTTTELSILLTSCLTAIKNHVIKYCTTVYERNGKNLF